MREILLTRGLKALVDDNDYNCLSKFKWCATNGRNTFYAIRGVSKNGKSTTILMHRVIMGDPCGIICDHIDGNGLNNQRDNLRLCNRFQNQRNRKIQSNNKSGVMGIRFDYGINKYRAVINVDGKHKYLGNFNDIISAAIAYNSAAIMYYDEFASLNNISELRKLHAKD